MKKAFTSPGPWRVAESQGGSLYIYPAGSNSPLKPNVKVARRGTLTMLANINLMAAAPELYHALKETMDVIGDSDFLGRERCQYAIRKAEGLV